MKGVACHQIFIVLSLNSSGTQKRLSWMVSILSTNDWRLKLVGWAGLSPSKRFPFMRTPEKATRKHHLTIGWSFGEGEYSHQAETWWSKWGVGIPQYKTLVEGCNGRVNVDAWTLWGWCNSNLFFESLSLTCYLWKKTLPQLRLQFVSLSTTCSCNLLLHNIRGAKGFFA